MDSDSDTLLELRMEKASFLKNVVEVLSDLFSEAHFNFSRTDLELQAMDTGGFTLVVLQLPAKAFSRYICDRDHLYTGLNLAEMATAFSFANNEDIVTIKAQEGTVTITFKSPSGMIRSFDLSFVSVNNVPVKIPKYLESDYQAIVRMPSAEFMHFCNELSSLADTRDWDTNDWDTGDKETAVRITVDRDCVNFFTCAGRGTLTIACLQTQTVDKPKEATSIEMKEEVSLNFGLRYMNSLSKASILYDQVTINLSSNLPAMFEYKVAEMGSIRYYLMPSEMEDETQGSETQGISKEDKMQK